MPKARTVSITSAIGLHEPALFAAAVAMVGVLYVVCIDDVAGLYVDDAWYVLLAKALASGDGFTLVNAPIPAVMPFYPPGFPALLALLFLLAPEFPDNVWLLKLVSIFAAIATAVLLRHYFLHVRRTSAWLASGLAMLTLACSTLHFLATSTIMSEATFLLIQIAALIALERCVAATSRRKALLVGAIAGALVAFTVLVRTQGVTLVLAAGLYLARAPARRAALSFAAVLAAILVPWQLHVVASTPSAAQRNVVNDAIAAPYSEQFWMRHAGHGEFGQASFAELPQRFADGARNLATHAIGWLYLSPGIASRLRARGSIEANVLVILSLILTALTAIGLGHLLRCAPTAAEIHVSLSLLLLIAWPFPPDRLLLPLLPLLAFYAAHGLGQIVRWVHVATAWEARAPGALIALLLTVNLISLAYDVADARGAATGSRTLWRRAFAENSRVVAWVRSRVPRHVVLATHNPAFVHLYTGNPTVGSWDDATDVARWRAVRARYWIDSTMAAYRKPDMRRSGLPPLMQTPMLRLGVYRLPSG